jgi:translation initiation factor 1 (eIF-1/SUI1)
VALREAGRWQAVAIATWNVDFDELELRGRQGCSHSLVHLLDDFLWLEGDGRVPSAPLTDVAAAEQELAAIQAAARAREEALAQEVAAAQAAARREAFLQEAPKAIKRKEKYLRQTLQLREQVDAGLVTPDPSQAEKLARLPMVEAELAELRAALAQTEAGLDLALPCVTDEKPEAAGLEQPTPESWEARDADAEALAEPTAAGAVDAAADVDVVGEDDPHQPALETSPEAGAASAEAELPELDPGAALMSMDEWLESATLAAFQRTVLDKHLPLLLSTLYANHILPMAAQMGRRPAGSLNLKLTRWKKLAAFLAEWQHLGMVGLQTIKAGVEELVSVNRLHDRYLGFDVDAALAEDADAAGGAVSFATTERAAAASANEFKVPAHGPKKITCELKQVRGKNVTVVTALGKFGIHLDEELRRDLARHFSVAVSYQEMADRSLGTAIHVQGKYVVQVVAFLEARYKIPPRYWNVSHKGLTKANKQ